MYIARCRPTSWIDILGEEYRLHMAIFQPQLHSSLSICTKRFTPSNIKPPCQQNLQINIQSPIPRSPLALQRADCSPRRLKILVTEKFPSHTAPPTGLADDVGGLFHRRRHGIAIQLARDVQEGLDGKFTDTRRGG